MEEHNAREHEGDGEDTTALVNVEDNFVVPTQEGNDDSVEFYILHCQQTSHIIQDKFTCAQGGEFDVEDHVISKLYYQKWGCNDNGYVYLCNSHVTFIYTYLVLACKFPLLPTHHQMKGDEVVYQLLEEALEVIKFQFDVSSQLVSA